MTKKHSRYELIHSPAYHEDTPIVLVFSAQHPAIYIVNDWLDKLYEETQIQQKIWQIIGSAGLGIESHSLGDRLRHDCADRSASDDLSIAKLETYFYDNFKDYVDGWFIKKDHKRCVVDFKFETQCTLGDVRKLEESQLNDMTIVIDTGVSYEAL